MSCVFNSARSRIWLIWTAVSPDTNFGVADGVDKQRGYDTFANRWGLELYCDGQQMGSPRPSRLV